MEKIEFIIENKFPQNSAITGMMGKIFIKFWSSGSNSW